MAKAKVEGKAAQAAKHLTQWTGQFGVAHEMSRRGYVVAHTIGNTPGADLFCQSPKGKQFPVEVKTATTRTYVLFQKHFFEAPPVEGRCFVIVFVPKLLTEKPSYFVLTEEELRALYKVQKRIGKAKLKIRGKPYAKFAPGIKFPLFAPFIDKWVSLPQ